MDKPLEGLGPRYIDWLGCDPLPVDADLLPGFVPGYQTTIQNTSIWCKRLKATHVSREATNLRRRKV